jgi:pimeloyl-ACP methyl ester carboxylesterase
VSAWHIAFNTLLLGGKYEAHNISHSRQPAHRRWRPAAFHRLRARRRAGTVRAADGVPIRYWVRGQGDPTLVFIHGLANDHSIWREQVDVFARNHKLVTVDLGGHGASGVNRASWSIAGLAGDVESVLKALALKRVVLIGHSMGGPVALLAAGRMPDRILGVIGVDTLHNAEFKLPEDQAKEVLAKFEANFAGTMRDGVRTMFSEKADPALVRWVAEKSAATDKKAAFALERARIRGARADGLDAAPGHSNGHGQRVELERKQ